jgi:hypothetical protein
MQSQVTVKSKVRTLTEYNANIASAICTIAQVSSDAQFPAYLQTWANLEATNYLEQLQHCCNTVATNKQWPPPVISHDLATEVAQGNIHSPEILNVTSGLSIVLILANSSPNAKHVGESACMLQLITQGGYMVPIDTMQHMMVHGDLDVVSLTTHFINTLQAY